MSDKKNIDRLFQESFKNFEEVPGEHIWGNIEVQLGKKRPKERRVLPVWWKLGGVAAALVLLFTLIYPSLFTDNITNDSPNEIITSSPLEKDSNTSDKKNNPPDNSTIDKVVEGQNSIVVDESESPDNEQNTSNKTRDKNQLTSTKSRGYKNITKHADAGEHVSPYESTSPKIMSDKEYADMSIEDTNIPAVIERVNQTNPQEIVDKKVIDSLLLKKREAEAIEDAEVVNEVVENTDKKRSLIEEVIKEQEFEEEDVDGENSIQSKRWSVRPNVAPVYFDSFGNGSPLDASFADNSKSGNVNMSYGINIAYELSKRLSIRSGVNKVNLGYDTNEIAFSPTLQSVKSLDNVEASSDLNMVVFDKNIQTANDAFSSVETSAKTARFDGVMTQELGYIEVPLELEYKLIDKKIGVRLIGGLSSLFLTNSNVLLKANKLTTSAGDAKNLNNVNFSTNVGLGVDYEINDKLKLNIEPILKYQLNTFSNESGTFQPYSLGVYTGFSFRF